MSELMDWFTREIRELGFAGLEGVYDYLSTMPDAQVLEYLESLLGSETRIKEFANSYIQRRSQGSQDEQPAASQSSFSDAELGWAQTTRAPPKAKKSKGKDRKLGKGSQQTQQESKSFARIVSKMNSRAPNTEQARAIHDAPVERMRQQVREYRKTKRPINCIHCGKIECPIQEDGACSFCRSPLFSIWKPPEKRQSDPRFMQTSSEGETVYGAAHKKAATKYCTVLGRYVRRPTLHENVYVQPELRDLTGRTYGGRLARDVEDTKNMAESSAMSGTHSNTSTFPTVIEQSERRSKEVLRTWKAGSSTKDSAFSVQGRLLVDDLPPCVCLPDR